MLMPGNMSFCSQMLVQTKPMEELTIFQVEVLHVHILYHTMPKYVFDLFDCLLEYVNKVNVQSVSFVIISCAALDEA